MIKCDTCDMWKLEDGQKRCGIFGAHCLNALSWCKTLEPAGWNGVLEEKRNCKNYNQEETNKTEWGERYGQCYCDRSMCYRDCKGKKCKGYRKKTITVDDL